MNLTYFQFACGVENPLTFVKSLIFHDHDCTSFNYEFLMSSKTKRDWG